MREPLRKLFGYGHAQGIGDHRHMARRRAQVGINLRPLARRLRVDHIFECQDVPFDQLGDSGFW